MRKVKWEIRNNYMTGKNFKEYDEFTYECRDDDVWITISTPLPKEQKPKSS